MLLLDSVLSDIIDLRPELLFTFRLALEHIVFVKSVVVFLDHCDAIGICL